MYKLDKDENALYKKVRNEILKIIIEMNLNPNELLPSEGKIAELCGVSKMTSKLALNLLAEEGIVYRVPRRGTFLTDIDINTIKDMIKNYSSASVDAREIGKDNFIMLILPSIDYYTGDIIRFISASAEDNNLNVIIKFSNSNPQIEERILSEASRTPEIKGIILFPARSSSFGVKLLNLKLQNYPIVIIDRVFKDIIFDSVFHDHFSGAKAITSYLIKNGHENIGFISDNISNITSREERYHGYIEAMLENNKLIKNEYILFVADGNYSNSITDNPEIDKFCVYLKKNPDITAVFCGSDYKAASLYYAASRMGLKVPENLSIAGFSNNSILNFLPLRITTVQQPVKELSHEAVKLLLHKINNNLSQPKIIKVNTNIIEGKSVARI